MCFSNWSERFRVSELSSAIGAITKHVFCVVVVADAGGAALSLDEDLL
jgi:hypothetical protein